MAANKTDDALRTQCPECQTVLRVDRDQLARRNGVARCGRCATVFIAEKYAVQTVPKAPKPASPKPSPDVKKTATARKSPKTPAKPVAPRGPATAKNAAAPIERAPVGEPETTSPQTAEEMEELLDEARRSIFGEPVSRTQPIYWMLGITVASMLLLGQFTYFNRTELSEYAELKPAVLAFCRALNCDIEMRRDVARIDLTKSTIAPHPTVKHALRIRIAMVNRAKFVQPYPLLEVSLSDSGGFLLARRSFNHHQYLSRPEKATGDMLPSVLVNGVLDITNPDDKAVGYELRLVSS